MTFHAATFHLQETGLHRGMHTYIKKKKERKQDLTAREISVSLVGDSEQQEAQWPNITRSSRTWDSPCSRSLSSFFLSYQTMFMPFQATANNLDLEGVATCTYRSLVV